MKRTIKLALAAAVALTATSAFATNGDNLIGLGAKSRSMGGTGIAHYNGSESATANPALITKGKGTQFTFGGTYFSPDVEIQATGSGAPGSAVSAQSDAKHNVIPYVALTNNLDNGVAVGMSMFGSAGMGTDWRDVPENAGAGQMGLFSMRSNLMLLKFSVPVAYGQDNWSVGIAPVMMYGALDMSFNNHFAGSVDVGNGSSADFGLGYEAGAAYTIPEAGLTLAASYHSPIMMEYKDQISTTAAAFGYVPGSTFGPFSDKLEQPSEIGIGLDWTSGDVSVTADIKRVNWSDTQGYGDFGWQDQNVYAVGAEYRMDKLALRAGYNYAKNPIPNNMDGRNVGGGNTHGDTMNALNHVMFPGITEKHYTIGAGYDFTKNVSADFAVTYATSPSVMVSAQTVQLGYVTVKNDQKAASANLNLKF